MCGWHSKWDVIFLEPVCGWIPYQVLPQVPCTGTCGISSFQPLTLNCTHTNAPDPLSYKTNYLQTSLLSFKHNINIDWELAASWLTIQVNITFLLIYSIGRKQRWIRSGSCRSPEDATWRYGWWLLKQRHRGALAATVHDGCFSDTPAHFHAMRQT